MPSAKVGRGRAKNEEGVEEEGVEEVEEEGWRGGVRKRGRKWKW